MLDSFIPPPPKTHGLFNIPAILCRQLRVIARVADPLFCCYPPCPPPWLSDVAQSGSGSRLARVWLLMEKRAFRVDCLQKWGSIGIRIFRSLQSGGSIGIKGARKPCKFHAFLMISVPVLFSISFCFPPHILSLLANRRFTCMRAHILQLVSSASFAQGWAWLKKRLRLARNLLFARVAFFFVFVLLLFSPPAHPFRAQGPGSRSQTTPIGPTPGHHLGHFWFDLKS